MTLARLDVVAAAAVLGLAGSWDAHASTAIWATCSASGQKPDASAQTDAVDLSREQALIDDANTALQSSDYATARAKVAEATTALLSRGAAERSEVWLMILDSAGHAAWSSQDPLTAHAAWSQVFEVRARALPDDDLDLQRARHNLAMTMHSLGDLEGARALKDKVLEVYSRTLPDDHPELQRARLNLGVTMLQLGDLAGARRLFEKELEVRSSVLPDDHPDLQLARLNLAATMRALGDLAGARALEEQVLEIRSRTLPDDHPDLQWARQSVAATMLELGDLANARALFEKVLEVRSRTLPEDHLDLQAALGNLAGTMYSLGDLAGARALQERVLAVRTRTLPDDHPDLQAARLSLAATIHRLGELEGARALQEKALEVLSSTLPDDHPDLQSARQALAATLHVLGDLAGARALEEQVLEVRSRTLPDDHPDLQSARQGLAATMHALGDLAGARALEEQVLEARSRTLPDDHPDLQRARGSLGWTMLVLGDRVTARALFEKVLDVFSRTRSDDHPDLQWARGSLATTLHDLGDLVGARALFEKVLEVRSRTLPDDHPDLQWARHALAETIRNLGDVAGARALEEKVLEVRSMVLPDDHPRLQSARINLAATIAAESALASRAEGEGASEEGRRMHCERLLLDLARTRTRAARAVLLSTSSREAEERCAQLAYEIDVGLSFSRGFGVFDRSPALESAFFELCETTRGAALTAASVARRAAGDSRYGERRAALARASEELTNLVRREGASASDFDRARVQRETAERELVALAREVAREELGGVEVSATALATALGEGAAAIGFRRFTDWRVEVEGGTDSGRRPRTQEVTAWRLCAFVVRGSKASASSSANAMAEPRASSSDEVTANMVASESLSLVDLGPIEPIERAVREWRAAVGIAQGRGIVREEIGSSGDAQVDGHALRRLVFDPLLDVIGESRRIVLVLDDLLHLVAFDALPLDSDGSSRIGDRWTIETRATLAELLDPASGPPEDGGFLGVGGVSYDGERDAPVIASADAPDTESRPVQVASILRGGAWGGGFTALPATVEEVEGIELSFADAHGPDAERTLLDGSQATRERLLALAPGSRFLHVATHGWFANESIRSWSDPGPIDVKSGLGLRQSGEEEVKGMSPMLLCGLALAGANLPEDSAGRASGLITAEEIAALDLSNCELAVLSACDTNAGERRAGQGVASLQKALHMAGARTVITSLWQVPDEATKDLMLDFYRRIWVEGKPKGQALWEAKKRLREAVDERGEPLYAMRDWAAWVLTGAPE